MSAQVCAAARLLVVAHEKGEVRVYQHSAAAREVTCCHLRPGPGCGGSPVTLALLPARCRVCFKDRIS